MSDQDWTRQTDLQRRRFLRTVGIGGLGLGLAASGLIPVRAHAGPAAGEMLMRAIPKSGERIPAVGLGTARTYDLGNLAGVPDEKLDELREVMRVFYDQGGRLVDTSPMYGTSEELIGRFSEDLGITDELFMATKVWTRGRAAGMRQMERSMELLHSDPVDMMQIHNLVDWRTHYKTLREWQEAGRVRYIGITHSRSTAHEEVERILRAERFDVLQINYNAIDRNAEKSLFPYVQDQGIAVLANVPFGNAELFRLTRGHELPEWAAEFDADTWAQLFLKFVLSHPAVTCTIPATSNPRHVADNTTAAYGRLPNESQRRRIIEHLEAL